MAQYDRFRRENTAPKNARDIGVYKDGKKVGRIPLGCLAPPPVGKPLYSFGLLADTHIGSYSGYYDQDGNLDEPYRGRAAVRKENFEKALRRLKNEAVDFICIAGDAIDDGRVVWGWKDYADAVEKCAGGIPVYTICGNEQHDPWRYDEVKEYAPIYAGMNQCVYHFFKGDDLFIMCGVWTAANDEKTGRGWIQMMMREDLIAIRKLMNEHKDKRCFFIQHIRPSVKWDDYDLPAYITPDADGNYLMQSHGYLPLSFYSHFKNAIVFHGHSHTAFDMQEEWPSLHANYMTKHFTGSSWIELGHRGVHIPALYAHGEGYIVEVYESGIFLRGLNLSENKELPLSNYWVDTTPIAVDADY